MNLEAYTFAKLPPQSTELEEVVLGACLLEESAVAIAVELLIPDHFYLPQHKIVFEAIFSLFKSGMAVDMLTCVNRLKEVGKIEEIGGVLFISQLTNKITSTAHLESHIHIIIEKYLARQTNKIAMLAVKESYEETKDVFELLDEISLKLLNLRNSTIKNKPEHIEIISNENMKQIINRSKSDKKTLGIPTGFKGLDKILGGWIDGQHYILAGRPGSGKTSFLTSQIYNIGIEQKIPCGVFSLEMTKEQIEYRLKTILTGIPNNRIISGNIYQEEWEKLYNATNIISKSPIYIDDSSTLNIVDLRSKVINLVQKHGVKIVFIDFIQRMQSADKNLRDQRLMINEVSGGITRIAKDLQIPIIDLSQLSRAVEASKFKIPELSHLKESGNLEEDAYGVMFLYRPEYYGLDTFSEENSHIKAENKAQIIVAKHRNGPVGSEILTFDKSTMHFKDLEERFNAMTFEQKINDLGSKKGKEEDFNDDF